MEKFLRIGLLSVALLIISGCSNRGYQQDFLNSGAAPSHRMTVAILPFENLTTHRNAGIIVSEIMNTELLRKGMFSIIEQSRVRKWMANNKINHTQMTETTYAQAVARALGVHAVIIGSVSEFGYQHGLKEEPVAGVNVRLVSGATGQVLWASSSSDVGRGLFFRDSVNETAQRVVIRMVNALSQNILKGNIHTHSHSHHHQPQQHYQAPQHAYTQQAYPQY